ncbi:hypothetical protein [Streptomyces chartreusis]|uniref:hypothetical protein n=1 Tax=Streptomyces chartreusis TaxID=1969 RepID=UPI00340BCAF1
MAYVRVYRALTKTMPAADAAQLLAELRQDHGDEITDAITADLDGKFRRTATDSHAAFRNKKRAYGTSMRVVQAVRDLTRVPRT